MDMFHKYAIAEVINSERHAELIDGAVVIQDKTTVSHNLAISKISTAFINYFYSRNDTARVFSGNVALYVNELCNNDTNFFLPDIMVVKDNAGIKENGVHTVPSFVAEITSEETRNYDYHNKLGIYRKIGVDEYWIVDLQERQVFQYLSSNAYVPQSFIHPQTMKTAIFSDLVIDFSSVMGIP